MKANEHFKPTEQNETILNENSVEDGEKEGEQIGYGQEEEKICIIFLDIKISFHQTNQLTSILYYYFPPFSILINNYAPKHINALFEAQHDRTGTSRGGI